MFRVVVGVLVGALVVGAGGVSGVATASAVDTVGHVKCSAGSGGVGSVIDPWKSIADATRALKEPDTSFTSVILDSGGGSCVGTLRVGKSGTEADPFVIASSDPKNPVTVDGGGSGGALILDDVSYVTVRHVTFTNNPVTDEPGADGVAAVRVRATKAPVSDITFDGVRLQSVNCTVGNCGRTTDPIDAVACKVHDPKVEACSTALAGLSVIAMGPASATVRNVTVTRSVFDHVGLYGIKTWSKWNERDMPGQAVPITGVHVKDSTFRDIPGGAAVFGATDGAMFTGNNVIRFAQNANYTSAGVYPYYGTNTTIRGNVFRDGGGGPVSSCPQNAGGTCQKDGQAVDLDGGAINTLVEHNVSVNNDRGFLMLCRETKPNDADRIKNAVVRFNRSVGDGGYGVRLACSGNVHGVQVYNNAWVLTRTGAEPFQFVSNTESHPKVASQQPLNWGNQLNVFNNTVTNLSGKTVTNRSGVTVHTSVYAENLEQNRYEAASNRYDGPAGTVEEPTEPVITNAGNTIHPVQYFADAGVPVVLCGTTEKATTPWRSGRDQVSAAWRSCTNPAELAGTPIPAAGWPVPAPTDVFGRTVNTAAPLIGVDQQPFASTTVTPQQGPRPTFTGTGQPGATVEVKGSTRVVCITEPISSDGHWRCVASVDLAADLYNLYAVEHSSPDGTNDPQLRIPIRVS